MTSDTKWIIGTMIVLAGLLLQQDSSIKSDIASLKSDIQEIRADIRELRSLHMQAAMRERTQRLGDEGASHNGP